MNRFSKTNFTCIKFRHTHTHTYIDSIAQTTKLLLLSHIHTQRHLFLAKLYSFLYEVINHIIHNNSQTIIIIIIIIYWILCLMCVLFSLLFDGFRRLQICVPGALVIAIVQLLLYDCLTSSTICDTIGRTYIHIFAHRICRVGQKATGRSRKF